MRHLAGGHTELQSIIVRGLEGAFPGVQFFLDPQDLEEYTVYWRWGQGAPAESAVAEYFQRQWPQFTLHTGNSEGKSFQGKTGGIVNGATAGTPDIAALLAQMQTKKANQKTCKHCGATSRKSAKCCANCGRCYPQCVCCGHMLYDDTKFCEGCGLTYCSYH